MRRKSLGAVKIAARAKAKRSNLDAEMFQSPDHNRGWVAVEFAANSAETNPVNQCHQASTKVCAILRVRPLRSGPATRSQRASRRDREGCQGMRQVQGPHPL